MNQASAVPGPAPDVSGLLAQYGCGPIQFTGTDGLYGRHLLFDNVIDPAAADMRDRFEAAARSVRDVLSQRWVLNAALTIGTRDGATIEMAEEAGEENFFLFGLTAQQVADSRSWYDPHWHYDHEPETRAALDLIFSDYFSRHSPVSSRRCATRC